MNLPKVKISSSGQMTWHGADISWSLNFKAKHASLTRLESSEMRSFTHQASNDMITCKWKGHPIIGDPFEVTVIWKNDDGLLSGTIGWEGGNKHETIEDVCFPVVTMPMPKGACIFTPYGQGSVFKINGPAFAAPTLIDRNAGMIASITMQYSALTSPDGSYYFDTKDTKFHSKSYEYLAVENRSKVRYIGIHPLPLDSQTPGAHLRHPGIGLFAGVCMIPLAGLG